VLNLNAVQSTSMLDKSMADNGTSGNVSDDGNVTNDVNVTDDGNVTDDVNATDDGNASGRLINDLSAIIWNKYLYYNIFQFLVREIFEWFFY
jgi:hypothetical protein